MSSDVSLVENNLNCSAQLEMQPIREAMAANNWREALAMLQVLISAEPEHSEAVLALGFCLDALSLPDAGVGVVQSLIDTTPSESRLALYNTLAFRLNDAGRFVEAALLEPYLKNTFSGRVALAHAMIRMGLDEAALEELQKIEENKNVLPQYLAEVARHRGIIAAMNNNYSDAVKPYREAIALGCNDRHIHFSLAYALLAQERWQEGWREYGGWRSNPRPEFSHIPVWNGESVDGKVVLVNSDQGFGDVIFGLRWLPRLQAKAQVVFHTYPDILEMLEGVDGSREVDEHVLAPLLPEVQMNLLDLPRVLGDLATDISGAPYLVARADRVKFWADRLADFGDGIKVGLVWAGNPNQQNDHNRSASLQDFLPLAVLPGVTWVSLQKGDVSAALSDMPESMNIVDLGGELNDFADTAAVVSQLDLVITVCTSVAHLSGAIGASFWLLAAASHVDFRWLEKGARSPWYESARIFRQSKRGDWNSLVRSELLPALLFWLDEETRRARLSQVDLAWLDRLQGRIDNASYVEKLGVQVENVLLQRGLAQALQENDSALLEHLLAVVCEEHAEGAACALAQWYAAQGLEEEALQILTTLWQQKPGLPRSSCLTLVELLFAEKRLGEARAVLLQAIETNPACADLYYWLGRTAWRLGEADLSLNSFRHAVALQSRHAGAWNGIGFVLMQQPAMIAEAGLHLQKAVLLTPELALAWRNLGQLASDRGALHFAVACLKRAIQLEPIPAVYQQLGVLLGRLWRAGEEGGSERALEFFTHLERMSPDDPSVAYCLAHGYRDVGRLDEAIFWMNKAVAAYPENSEYQMSLGWLLLAKGDCVPGWAAYVAGMSRRETVMPEWTGDALGERSLLVFQDQGYGDLFQFVDLVRNIEGNVTLAVHHAALNFMRDQNFPFKVCLIDEIDWQIRSHDVQIAQMKLPFLQNVDLKKTQPRWPFLRADEERRQRFHEQFSSQKKLRVGIVWSGSSRFSGNATRSTHFRDWQTLKDIQGVTFYSLQKDIYSNQALEFPEFPLVNLAIDLADFSDTAAAICELDLVISTCTAVAHLAGGLGKKVWVLLPSVDPDFRWLRDRNDCPWYPQARLFRKRDGQPWSSLIAEMGRALVEEESKCRQ